jgi:hypothetical protein
MSDQITLSKDLALSRNALDRLDRLDSSKFPTLPLKKLESFFNAF